MCCRAVVSSRHNYRLEPPSTATVEGDLTGSSELDSHQRGQTLTREPYMPRFNTGERLRHTGWSLP